MADALAIGPDPADACGPRPASDSRVPTRTFAPRPGAFASYKKKGKWAAAAKQAGLSKADGDRLNDAAEVHYAACCEAWVSLAPGRRQPRSWRR